MQNFVFGIYLRFAMSDLVLILVLYIKKSNSELTTLKFEERHTLI